MKRSTILLITGAAAVAAGVVAVRSAAAGPPPPPVHGTGESRVQPAPDDGYWTPQRMRDARPAPMPEDDG
ncbi:hypothetical protein ACFY4C_30165 [Actinomadura viridis]|uniref:hypothetical protein n=1 Tax=Actinomadura viridis TaxID=58110 RepID=UPI0036C2A560